MHQVYVNLIDRYLLGIVPRLMNLEACYYSSLSESQLVSRLDETFRLGPPSHQHYALSPTDALSPSVSTLAI